MACVDRRRGAEPLWMSSSVSDSEGEEVDEFELEELHLADEDERDGAAGGGSGGGGGVEAARRSNVDLRMDHLPPGQSSAPLTSATPHDLGCQRRGFSMGADVWWCAVMCWDVL